MRPKPRKPNIKSPNSTRTQGGATAPRCLCWCIPQPHSIQFYFVPVACFSRCSTFQASVTTRSLCYNLYLILTTPQFTLRGSPFTAWPLAFLGNLRENYNHVSRTLYAWKIGAMEVTPKFDTRWAGCEFSWTTVAMVFTTWTQLSRDNGHVGYSNFLMERFYLLNTLNFCISLSMVVEVLLTPEVYSGHFS